MRIIRAAARVFATTGYRGATTRRIAQEADVNEVTIFRNFGSKAELIREAIAYYGRAEEFRGLPETPVDPRAELVEWSRWHLRHLYHVRSLIRTCMGESEEHPEIMSCASERPVRVRRELCGYLRRLREGGLADAGVDADAAATMLMGVLFSDAVSRDLMPESFGYSLEEAPARYVDLFLRAIGATGGNGSLNGAEAR